MMDVLSSADSDSLPNQLSAYSFRDAQCRYGKPDLLNWNYVTCILHVSVMIRDGTQRNIYVFLQNITALTKC